MAIEFVDVLDAANNTYDPTNSTLTDTRVQDAIDSLDAKIVAAQALLTQIETQVALLNE